MDDDSTHNVFRFFTEVGIIAQFSARLIEKNLPERITHLHFGLLGHMSRRPDGETPQQLAYAFQVPKTSMTHMIRVLEAEGYIEIVPNPEDARSKLAKITPKGGELLMQAYAKSAQDAAIGAGRARRRCLRPDLVCRLLGLSRHAGPDGDPGGD